MAERNCCLWIEVGVSAGTDLSHAIWDAIELVYRLKCNVSFRFNGILLLVTPRSTYNELMAEYEKGFGTWRDGNRKDDAAGEAKATGDHS